MGDSTTNNPPPPGTPADASTSAATTPVSNPGPVAGTSKNKESEKKELTEAEKAQKANRDADHESEKEFNRKYYTALLNDNKINLNLRRPDRQPIAENENPNPGLGEATPIKLRPGEYLMDYLVDKELFGRKLGEKTKTLSMIVDDKSIHLTNVPDNQKDFVAAYKQVMRAYASSMGEDVLVLSFPNVKDASDIEPNRIQWILEAAAGEGVSIQFDSKVIEKLSLMQKKDPKRAQELYDLQAQVNNAAYELGKGSEKNNLIAHERQAQELSKQMKSLEEAKNGLANELKKTPEDAKKVKEQIDKLEAASKAVGGALVKIQGNIKDKPISAAKTASYNASYQMAQDALAKVGEEFTGVKLKDEKNQKALQSVVGDIGQQKDMLAKVVAAAKPAEASIRNSVR